MAGDEPEHLTQMLLRRAGLLLRVGMWSGRWGMCVGPVCCWVEIMVGTRVQHVGRGADV